MFKDFLGCVPFPGHGEDLPGCGPV